MNLIKSEEITKESPGTQLSISVFGIAAGSAIGDPTGISAATASVIAKRGGIASKTRSYKERMRLDEV